MGAAGLYPTCRKRRRASLDGQPPASPRSGWGVTSESNTEREVSQSVWNFRWELRLGGPWGQVLGSGSINHPEIEKGARFLEGGLSSAWEEARKQYGPSVRLTAITSSQKMTEEEKNGS